MFSRYGINFSKQIPISDTHLDSQEEVDNMFMASQYLDDMINDKDLTVFVFSATGHTRPTSVAIIYLQLFQNKADSADNLAAFVKNHFQMSIPNLKAVESVIQQRKNFDMSMRFQTSAKKDQSPGTSDKKKRAERIVSDAQRQAFEVTQKTLQFTEEVTPTKKISLTDVINDSDDEEKYVDERVERDARLKKLAEEAERITAQQKRQTISPIVEENTFDQQ